MIKSRLGVLFAALLALAGGAPSVSGAETPPKKINLKDFPATTVEDVVVPIPSEVFNALDKLGTVAWRSEVRTTFAKSRTGGRPQIALLLGSVIADGFLAVQAEDTERVIEIGKTVIKLADDISVKQAVLAHCNAIIEAARTRDWKMVRRELDNTQRDVRQAMDALKDTELSQLVSIGGWIRGTEALTSLVLRDYSANRAELLSQPDLVALFDRQLAVMSPRLRESSLVSKVRSGLGEIRPLVGEATISKKSVESINVVTKRLSRDISPADS